MSLISFVHPKFLVVCAVINKVESGHRRSLIFDFLKVPWGRDGPSCLSPACGLQDGQQSETYDAAGSCGLRVGEERDFTFEETRRRKYRRRKTFEELFWCVEVVCW